MEKLNFDFSLNPKQLEDRKELALKLLKDKRVISFLNERKLEDELVHDKVSMFETYCANLDKCKNCPGLHACKQDENGYVLSLEMNPLLSFELKPCRYQKEKIAQTSHKKYFLYQDIHDEYLLADLKTLLNDDADQSYKESIGKLVQWINKDKKSGLYLYGNLGSGKTHISMAILNFYAKQSKKVAFVNCPNFAYQFYSSYTEDDKREVKLEQMKNAYCLE